MPACELPNIRIIETNYGTAYYHAAVALRQHVLRSPLGLNYTPAQLAQDDSVIQFVAMHDEQIVGCVMLHHTDETTARLRQFAVSPAMQGQGVGAILLEKFEATARNRGYQRIVLSARQTAVHFYLKHGYQTVGESYTDVGLPHIGMEKAL